MSKLPKNCSQRTIGAEARKLVHYKLSAERWEYHEETGNDVGRDCTIELIENDVFVNKKIEGQIKGTTKPILLKNKDAYSFSMDIKTINYGLSSSVAFVLFFVLVEEEKVFYLPIQDYFIANPKLFDNIINNKSKINIHIPIDNLVSYNDYDLQQIAKSVYVDGPTKKLRKIN